MTNQGNLIEKMKQYAEKGKRAADDAIGRMAALAGELGDDDAASRLRETQGQLRKNTFRIVLVGRFKNGKSTTLNALLGGTTVPVNLSGHQGPMVVDDLPATAVLTTVRFSEQPYVRAWHHDGSSTPWPLDRYLRESTLDIDEEENQRRFGQIRQFEMGFPARLCAAGVEILDAPGMDDMPTRTLITKDATRACDAAIVVYRSDVLMGTGELAATGDLVADGVKVFTVVNLWNGRAADDRLRGFIWNRYVRDHQGGPAWAHQDFASRDIFLVDSRRAVAARYAGNESEVAASGLGVLEERLGEFLTRDRHRVHLEKFGKQADNLTDGIAQHIDQRQAATLADQESLRRKLADVQPRLDQLRARPQKIPVMFDRCRRDAQPELIESFGQMIDDTRATLPMHLKEADLAAGKGAFSSFQQKKLLDEAYTAISEFVTAQINNWGSTTAPNRLKPVLDQLAVDIDKEVSDIGRQIEAVHLDLTGWQQTHSASSVVSPTERVLSAVASVLAGNALGAITGGAGGWRGAVGSAAGALGAGIVLGVLGVTSAVVFWPVALAAAAVAGIFASNIGLEERAKKKALEDAEEQLVQLPMQTAPVIREKLRAMLDEQEQAVVDAVAGLIDEEIRNVEEMVRINQQDQAERDREQQRLATAQVRLAALRRELTEAVTRASQA